AWERPRSRAAWPSWPARPSSRSRRPSSPRSATWAATSTRWCAIWRRRRCRWCGTKSASACAPARARTPRSVGSTSFCPRRRARVPEAMEYLAEEEATKLIDVERITKEAIRRAEQSGIIFIDELDKVAGRESGHGPDVSREGVQRDLLPIVEGSTVSTKYGPVKTDHVLFIAAGAFHVAKPKDLIPELQGRFPIRVELEALSDADFVRILTEPENALTKQYTALLATEKIILDIRPDAVQEIARSAADGSARM